MRRRLVLAILFSSSLSDAAELPRILIDTQYTPAACTNTYTSATSLQTILNNAACGDTVCLTAGNTWTGAFTVPDHACSDTTWITVTTNRVGIDFPPQGTRVAPGDATKMAKISGSTSNFVSFNAGADHYRFVGIEFSATTSNINAMITTDGGGLADANHITFDRVYIHGDGTHDVIRGITGNGNYIALIESYVTDIFDVNDDSQAFDAWCGNGPYKIYNNRLQAAGENVMFGGAACNPDEAMLPHDIEIRRNLLDKPLGWASSYQGKNNLEFKTGVRVLVENNEIKNYWSTMIGTQQTIVSFKSFDDSGSCCPWIVTRDITFRNNLVQHSSSGIKTAGDTGTGAAPTRYVDIIDNAIVDIGSSWDAGGDGRGLTGVNGGLGPSNSSYNTIQANTAGTGAMIYCDSGSTMTSMTFGYNIGTLSDLGVKGGSCASGTACINQCYPSGTFDHNVVTGATCGNYPATTACPAASADIGFVNLAGNNFRLDSGSSYYATAQGGRDYGAFYPAAGVSFLDLEVQQSGTSMILRFGRPGLGDTQSCTWRVGASSGSSTKGIGRRYVVVTGLTNAQAYWPSIDCGDQDGDITPTYYTAATPSGGSRTQVIQTGAPPAYLTGAARATLEYSANSDMSSSTSTQNTSCGSGCSINLVATAGMQYWRWKWQNAADTVLATGIVQPILVQ